MPLTIAVGADPVILEPSQPVTLAAGIAAAQVLSQAGTTAARATNPLFCVQPRGDGGDRTLNLSARGVGGVPTTVTASLFASSDGVTWSLYQAAIALIAAGVSTDAQALHLVAGLSYQVLVTSLTLGSTATAVNVDGNVS